MALNGYFKQGLQNSIELKEDDVAAFVLLVQWMFTNRIDKPKSVHDGGYVPRPHMVSASPEVGAEALDEENGMGVEIGKAENHVAGKSSTTKNAPSPWRECYLGIWVYARLQVLADKLGMISLQDLALDVLRDGSVYFLHPQIMIWIYQNTHPSSPLRRCAARMASSALILRYVVPTYFDVVVASCDDFAHDLIQTLVREGEEVIYSRQPFHDRSCALYEHEHDKACPKGKIETFAHPEESCTETDEWTSSTVKPAICEEHDRTFRLSTRLRIEAQRVWDDVMGRCKRSGGEIHTLGQLGSTVLKELTRSMDMSWEKEYYVSV